MTGGLAPARDDARWGLVNGLIGVTLFAITLPATRIAVAELDVIVVALGRAVMAGACATVYLLATRASFPRAEWRRLAMVAACVVFGFPLLTSLAMRDLPASHGAIVIGLLPLATAVFAMAFAGERPSLGYWLAASAGSGTVVAYALLEGGGALDGGDLLLVGAVLAAGLGYAEGGRLSRTLGGPATIAWALVLALPVSIPVTALRIGAVPATTAVSPQAWLAFAYLSVFSMFIGFFFWYRGLAQGGVARVGQLQLLQPFLSILFAAALLGETLGGRSLPFAVAVVAIVAIGRRFAVGRSR